MSRRLAHQTQPIAVELHRLLRALDGVAPSGARRAPSNAVGQPTDDELPSPSMVARRLGELGGRLQALLASVRAEGSRRSAELHERLTELMRLLTAPSLAHTLEQADPSDAAWAGWRQRLSQAYAAVSLSLQEQSVEVPALRLTNYARSAFHVASALFVLLMIEHVVPPAQLVWVATGFAGTFWCLEALRRFHGPSREVLLRLLGRIAHPHERHRVNSSTWYATALILLGGLFDPSTAAIAVAIHGLADPAAAFIGRRWGRVGLVHGRTLEGTMAFVAVGIVAALAVQGIWHSVPVSTALVTASAGAFVAAIAELFSGRVDDNFSVPVAGALGVAGALVWLI